jgi:hypothetical protein
VSCTVTVNEHELVLFDASVAVHVTVVAPIGNSDPVTGEHTTVVPGQLSDVVGSANFTVAPHTFASFGTVTFAGHVITGACVSCTVTVNEHAAIWPPGSVAEQVTVVVPTMNVEPEAGEQVTVAPVQSGGTVGSEYITVALHCPGVFATVTSDGQVSVSTQVMHPPSRIVTLLETAFAVARSCRPSPLKSPTATERGPVPTGSGEEAAAVKSPMPSPSTIVTLLEPEFAVARSCRPSPLKSPTATETGRDPAGSGEEGAAVKSGVQEGTAPVAFSLRRGVSPSVAGDGAGPAPAAAKAGPAFVAGTTTTSVTMAMRTHAEREIRIIGFSLGYAQDLSGTIHA